MSVLFPLNISCIRETMSILKLCLIYDVGLYKIQLVFSIRVLIVQLVNPVTMPGRIVVLQLKCFQLAFGSTICLLVHIGTRVHVPVNRDFNIILVLPHDPGLIAMHDILQYCYGVR